MTAKVNFSANLNGPKNSEQDRPLNLENLPHLAQRPLVGEVVTKHGKVQLTFSGVPSAYLPATNFLLTVTGEIDHEAIGRMAAMIPDGCVLDVCVQNRGRGPLVDSDFDVVSAVMEACEKAGKTKIRIRGWCESMLTGHPNSQMVKSLKAAYESDKTKPPFFYAVDKTSNTWFLDPENKKVRELGLQYVADLAKQGRLQGIVFDDQFSIPRYLLPEWWAFRYPGEEYVESVASDRAGKAVTAFLIECLTYWRELRTKAGYPPDTCVSINGKVELAEKTGQDVMQLIRLGLLTELNVQQYSHKPAVIQDNLASLQKKLLSLNKNELKNLPKIVSVALTERANRVNLTPAQRQEQIDIVKQFEINLNRELKNRGLAPIQVRVAMWDPELYLGRA